MDKQLTNEYYAMLEKFERREITQQQWYAFCASILNVIMEENKVFVDVPTAIFNNCARRDYRIKVASRIWSAVKANLE